MQLNERADARYTTVIYRRVGTTTEGRPNIGRHVNSTSAARETGGHVRLDVAVKYQRGFSQFDGKTIECTRAILRCA